MEQILKYCGQGIRAVVSVVLLFAILLGKGQLLETVSEKSADEIKREDLLYQDYKILKEEAEKPEPVLVENISNQTILAGEEVDWQEYVKAKDGNGKYYPVFLKEILDTEKKPLPQEEVQKKPGVLQFSKSGIYYLVVMLRNDAGKKRYYEITVLVKQRGDL